MSIERDETDKVDFDETINKFASIKARKVLFQSAFLSNLTGKGWIY